MRPVTSPPLTCIYSGQGPVREAPQRSRGRPAAAFVKWRASQIRRTPIPTARASEILPAIESLDFRQALEVSELCGACYRSKPTDLPLAKDDSFEYIIRTGDCQLLETQRPFKPLSNTSRVHGSIVELHPSPKHGAEPAAEPSLPRLVWAFGHLYFKDLRDAETAALGSSGQTPSLSSTQRHPRRHYGLCKTICRWMGWETGVRSSSTTKGTRMKCFPMSAFSLMSRSCYPLLRIGRTD